MFFSSLLILIFHLWINIFDRTSNLYNIEEVEERFHSRYNAKGKKYRYIINNSEMEKSY